MRPRTLVHDCDSRRPRSFETADDMCRFLDILLESRNLAEACRAYGCSYITLGKYRKQSRLFDMCVVRILADKPCSAGYTRTPRSLHPDNQWLRL